MPLVGEGFITCQGKDETVVLSYMFPIDDDPSRDKRMNGGDIRHFFNGLS
jgi:hypothetical protein